MQKLIPEQVQWYPSQRAGQADSTVTDVSGANRVGDHSLSSPFERDALEVQPLGLSVLHYMYSSPSHAVYVSSAAMCAVPLTQATFQQPVEWVPSKRVGQLNSTDLAVSVAEKAGLLFGLLVTAYPPALSST